jgi:hypothetical protein
LRFEYHKGFKDYLEFHILSVGREIELVALDIVAKMATTNIIVNFDEEQEGLIEIDSTSKFSP